MINKPIDVRILSIKGKFVDFIYRSSNSRSRMPKDNFRKKMKSEQFLIANLEMFHSRL